MVSQNFSLIYCIGFHALGLLHKIFSSFSTVVSGLCMFIIMFIIYFSFICLQQSLISGTYISEVRLTCVLHMAFKLPYIYDYIAKFYRQQAEVIQNHENAHLCNTGQGEPHHRNYKWLKLGCDQA
jgi:hypothetical protein